jgi:hypothetical protein
MANVTLDELEREVLAGVANHEKFWRNTDIGTRDIWMKNETDVTMAVKALLQLGFIVSHADRYGNSANIELSLTDSGRAHLGPTNIPGQPGYNPKSPTVRYPAGYVPGTPLPHETTLVASDFLTGHGVIANGTATFTLTNSKALPAGTTYVVTDQNGRTVQNGTPSLGANQITTVTVPNANGPLTLAVKGDGVTAEFAAYDTTTGAAQQYPASSVYPAGSAAYAPITPIADQPYVPGTTQYPDRGSYPNNPPVREPYNTDVGVSGATYPHSITNEPATNDPDIPGTNIPAN